MQITKRRKRQTGSAAERAANQSTKGAAKTRFAAGASGRPAAAAAAPAAGTMAGCKSSSDTRDCNDNVVVDDDHDRDKRSDDDPASFRKRKLKFEKLITTSKPTSDPLQVCIACKNPIARDEADEPDADTSATMNQINDYGNEVRVTSERKGELSFYVVLFSNEE